MRYKRLFKTIIKEKYPTASCLLITSAFHMPRAKKVFEAANIKVIPFINNKILIFIKLYVKKLFIIKIKVII